MRSLATSIGLSYLALTALAAAIGVFSTFRFVELGGSVERILQANYRSVRAAEGMVQAVERQDAARVYARAGDMAAARRTFAAGRGAFAHWYAEAVDGVVMPEEPPLLDSIRVAYDAYVLVADAAFAAAVDAPDPELEAAVPPAAARLRAGISRLLDVNQRAMIAASRRIEAASGAGVRAVALATLCAVIAGGLLGLRFARGLTSPLRRLAHAVSRVRRDHLDETVLVESEDEVGHLADAFNAMTARLRHYDALNVEALVAEQQKQERLVEAMPSPVFATDEGGRVALLNEAARRLLGPAPGGGWVGRPLTDAAIVLAALTPADGTADGPTGDGAPPDGTPHGAFGSDGVERDLVELQSDGVPRVFRPRRTTVPTPEGTYTITLLEDVTPFRDLDRARRDFLTAVSHELRTPLTSLGVALDLLLGQFIGTLTPDQRDLIEMAKLDQERLKALVAGLIDLARLEAGVAPPAPTTLDLPALLGESLGALQLPASQRDVTLTLDAPDDLPDVEGDARQLAWVASNLVGNALRHAPEHGHVTVRVSPADDGVRVAVEDDGPGVPAGSTETIFEPFVQAGGTTRPGGAGLGLAIARRVVQAHGGRIWAEPGPGGRFTFTLPLRRP